MPLISGAVAVFTAISTFVGSLGAVGGFLLKTAAGMGLSYAAQALAGKPKQQSQAFRVNGQIRAEGVVPRSYMSGMGMTAGSLAYTNTWTEISTPNAFFVKVIRLVDLPVKGLRRVMINGEWVTLDSTPHEDGRGYPVLEYRKGGKDYQWIKFYDGTQTEADAYLVSKFSTHPLYPYQSTRVGHGIAYAICTSRLNDKLFTGFPEFKFELESTKFYDPSKDDTAGGEGDQRWDTPSTWGGDGDDLPIVQAYNLCRGITYGGEWFYGLQGVSGAQLPVSAWIAAIEKCRANAEGPDGNEPQYRCGGEVQVSTRIADTVEALLTSCNGRLSEIGGVYKPVVGAPGEAVGWFTDDDIISTAGQSFTPFHGLADTINGIAAKYPEPEEGWNVKAAPTLYDEDFEKEDGNRRLLADVDYSMVPYKGQVQRLMKSALAEARRARRHTLTLPPKYWKYEPGDILEWTSARNGYVEKLFRIDGMTDLANLDVIVDITEVDPDDYDWDQEADYTPPVDGPVGVARPDPQPMTGWQAFPDYLQDDTETKKRPSIRVEFAAELDDVRAVRVQVRVKANEAGAFDGEIPYEELPEVSEGVAGVILNGTFLSETVYEVRGRFIPYSDRDTEWSSWIEVETPSVPEFELSVTERALLQRVDELSGDLRIMKSRLALLAGADINNSFMLEEYRGQINRSIGVSNGQLKAAVDIVEQALVTDRAALAAIFQGVYAETGAGTAESIFKVLALSDEDLQGAIAGIEMRVSAGMGGQLAEAAFSMYAVVDAILGLHSRMALKADQLDLIVGDVVIPAHGLQRGDRTKSAPVVAGSPKTITVDLREKDKTFTTLLTDDATVMFPVGAWVGAEWNHVIVQDGGGGYELDFDLTTFIVGGNLPQPHTSPGVYSLFRGLVLSMQPPVATFDFVRSGATTSATEAQFSIFPAVDGKTVWNLAADGPLTLDGPGTWTVMPLGIRLDCVLAIWGPGGTSGSVGEAQPAHPSAGTNSSFSGGAIATLTATAGGPSESVRRGSGQNRFSVGGTPGTASGNGTNQDGNAGGSGRVNSDTSYCGKGAGAPDGGAEIPELYFVAGSAQVRHGIEGNAPAGGARGAGYSAAAAGLRGYSGGGGSGAKVTKQYDVGYPLLEGVPYTLTLGAPGDPITATGNLPAQGARGGKARAVITSI